MSTNTKITALLGALSANEELARHGYSVFATPALAIVVQKDKIFQGLWRSLDDQLKWTPAASGQRSLSVATPEEAVALTLAALGVTARP